MKNLKSHIAKMAVSLAISAIFIISVPFALTGQVSGKNSKTPIANLAKSKTKTMRHPNSFDYPDFAFPEDVEHNADAALREGLKKKAWLKVLQSAMQKCIVAEGRQRESADSCLSILQSVGSQIPAPYNALAKVMQAELLSDTYSAQSWRYDSRRLPPGQMPEKTGLWDRNLFQTVVMELAKEARTDMMRYNHWEIGKISSLLQSHEEAVRGGLTIGDFVRDKLIECLEPFFSPTSGNVIPFTIDGRDAASTTSLTPGKLALELALETTGNLDPESSPLVVVSAVKDLLDVSPRSERVTLARAWVDRYSATPAAQGLLVLLYDNDELLRGDYEDIADESFSRDFHRNQQLEFYRTAQESLSKFPSGPYADRLKSVLSEMGAKSLMVKGNSQYLPDDSVIVQVTNRNHKTVTVVALEMPASAWRGGATLGQAVGRRVAASKKVTFDNEVPFSIEEDVNLGILPPGVYALAAYPEGSSLQSMAASKEDVAMFHVSALQSITERVVNGAASLYAVSAKNGAPISGASVLFQNRPSKKDPLFGRGYKTLEEILTDADGKVAVPSMAQYCDRVVIRKGSDWLNYSPYLRSGTDSKTYERRIRFFLDRAIAKPGEEIRFEAVCYLDNGTSMRSLPSEDVVVELINASDVSVDSLCLTSGPSGNCSGSFCLPEEGMHGRWQLRARYAKSVVSMAHGSSSFQVEDYKAPGFLVSVGALADSEDEAVTIAGTARTLSGMPLADAKVSLHISFLPIKRFLFGAGDDASFDAECLTDAEGRFELRLGISLLRSTPFGNAAYSVRAEVTDQAGETRSSESMFVLGHAFRIASDLPSKIKVRGDSLTLQTIVMDMVGNPVRKELVCDVYKGHLESIPGEARPLITKDFISPALVLPADSLPSGEYTFAVRFKDGNGQSPIISRTVLWRESDTVPPVNELLWVPETTLTASSGRDRVEVAFGSAARDQNVLCIVSNDNGVLDSSWIRPEGKMIRINVPAPSDTLRTYVKLVAIGNLNYRSAEIKILPASAATPLKVGVQSFRDRLRPGSDEEWKFRFSTGSLPAGNVSALAVMTDKGLNSLVSFRWNFTPRYGLRFRNPVMTSWNIDSGITFWGKYKNPGYGSFALPPYPAWIYGFGVTHALYECMDMCVSTSSKGEVPCGGAKALKYCNAAARDMEEMAENSVESEAMADAGSGTIESESVPLREAECPVAFFMPSLKADPRGDVTVSFRVPQYNTTWQFQLLGYSPDMQTASLCLDAVANKSVMIKLNAPAFLRTGDLIDIAATAFNNTSEARMLGGRIEIYDPVSNVILHSEEFPAQETAPLGARILRTPFSVPSDVATLAVRAYALSDGYSDGEQVAVPVLPSSTPVIESTPFWLAPGGREFKVTLPEYAPGSKLTLTYCDNPAWYALTALPSLVSDPGNTSTSIMQALYGNCIGAGLLKSHSDLRNGLLEIMAASEAGETDVLDSPLANNPDLKISKLEFTPWVNSARDESLRMHSLGNLLDPAGVKEAKSKCIEALLKMANVDGGLSWCPEDKSSMWATSRVLLWNSMLMRFGYMPQDALYQKMIREALAYMEKEILNGFSRIKPSDGDVESLRNFLYVRSFYQNTPLMPRESADFLGYVRRCKRLIKENWRNFSIYDKASCATLMARSGDKALAKEILQSIAQFATCTREKGMWFDAYQGVLFSPWDKLAVTAQVLEAYMDVDPKSEDVDLLRQWLLIQRQAEDWGNLPFGVELVQALLTAGSDWISDYGQTEIKIGRHNLLRDGKIPSYCELVLDLEPAQASGAALKIKRLSQSPAWGAVIRQRIQPIGDVHESGVDDIKISKTIFVLPSGDEGSASVAISPDDVVNLRKGDKVRVQLTVQTSRDMEYVVLNDCMGACLQPDQGISASDMVDSVWLYKEMRKDGVNFFIPYLRSGNFQISYDCHVSQSGVFSAGIATLQSLYAPSLTAHSAGMQLSSQQ